ncbi:MAG: PEP-CTERM sorting domain-containing protein [Rubrivivax sp.]
MYSILLGTTSNNLMRFELAVIVLANAWAFNAHATPVTTIDWGLHDPIEAALIQPKGNVDDYILFSVVADTAVLTSTAVSKHNGAANARRGGTVDLFQAIGDVPVGRYEFGDGTAGVGHEFDLQTGDYYYRIVSTGPGASGAAYTLSSSLSSETGLVEGGPTQANDVPEPQSHALVLVGLAALGWSMKRRKP